MQYEPTLSRAELIDFALNKYFARVDAKDMDAVLDCFHDTALSCVQTAFTRHSGKAEIARMLVMMLRTVVLAATWSACSRCTTSSSVTPSSASQRVRKPSDGATPGWGSCRCWAI